MWRGSLSGARHVGEEREPTRSFGPVRRRPAGEGIPWDRREPKALPLRSSQPVRPAQATSKINHPELRSALALFALVRAVTRIDSEHDVSEIWGELRRQDPHASDAVLLRRLLTLTTHHSESIGAETLLRWIAKRLLPDRDSSLWFSGQIRERSLQEMCQALAVRIPLWRLDQEDVRIISSDKKIRSWWNGLVEHCRKAQPAPRRSVRRPLRRSQ